MPCKWRCRHINTPLHLTYLAIHPYIKAHILCNYPLSPAIRHRSSFSNNLILMLVSNTVTAMPSLNKQWDKAFHKAASGECSRPWAPGEVGLFQKFYLFTEHSLPVREHNIRLNYSSMIYEAACLNVISLVQRAPSEKGLERKWGLGKELIDWCGSEFTCCVVVTGNKRGLGF